MNKAELERVILLNSQKPKIFCKICGKDITNGVWIKVDKKFMFVTDPIKHVRLRHLTDEFDNWHIAKLGQQPPSEETFLESR